METTTYITQVLNNLRVMGVIFAILSLAGVFIFGGSAEAYEGNNESLQATKFYRLMRICLWVLLVAIIIIVITPKA